MGKTFPQKEFRGIFELKKSALSRTKKKKNSLTWKRITRVNGFTDRGPAQDYTGLVPGYARKHPAKDVANEIAAELF